MKRKIEIKRGWSYLLLLCVVFTTSSEAQWSRQSSGTQHSLNSVYFLNPDTGFVAGDNGTIMATTDGGTVWSAIDIGIPNALGAIIFTDGSTGYVFASGGLILKTTDRGVSWSSLNVAGDVLLFLAACKTDDSTLFAVGVSPGNSELRSRIARTTDGGTTWQVKKFDSLTTLFSIYFPTHDTGYAVGLKNYSNAPILKTTDGGNSWSRQTSGINQSLHSVYFIDAETGYAGGGGGGLLRTSDGGSTWMSASVMKGLAATFTSICFTDDTSGYAITGFGSGGGIYKTTDGGDSWVDNTPGHPPSLNALFFVNRSVGYAVGDDGTILKTEDGGAISSVAHPDIEGPPEGFFLEQNYPNPFNPTTVIRYRLSAVSHVSLRVYDALGRKVQTLVDGIQQPGRHEAAFDGTRLPSGVYLCRMKAGAFTSVKKMLLAK